MSQPRKITGRTVLVGMMCFFGVIFAVNGTFVYFALGSWPGLSFDNAYRRGLDYNTVLDAAEEQSRLGWQSRIIQRRDQSGGPALEAVISDRTGKPVPDLDLEFHLRRPTHSGDDFQRPATEAPGGRYAINIGGGRAGYWQVDIRARSSSGKTYTMTHEVEVRE